MIQREKVRNDVIWERVNERLIMAVNSNARLPVWNAKETDERGAKFENLIYAFDINVINKPEESPIFWTGLIYRCDSYVVLHEPICQRVKNEGGLDDQRT